MDLADICLEHCKMNYTYSVPVIHHDLRQEETFVQIAFALESLCDNVNDAFRRIENRINGNRQKLEAINNRRVAVRTKIEQLMGSNKSTKVFSSAKYPFSANYENYSGLFNDDYPLKKSQSALKVTSKHQPLESKTLAEKLQFYHVKLSSKTQRKNWEVTPEEGLGCLPWDLGSVTSLLLFNTSENPYQRYVQLDPLGAISRTRQALLEEQAALEAPPISISQRDQPERPPVDSYFYSPGLGDVPLIDVPLDLPDLPGVADDLRYSMDMGPIIAPSVSTTPSLPDLPVVSESPSTVTESRSSLSSTLLPNTPASPLVIPSMPVVQNKQISAPSPAPAPPPPPPPPPLQLPSVSTDLPPVPPAPPPPPLPPPLCPTSSPPPESELISSATSNGKSKDPNLKHEGDPRANLMEAIRRAGGSGKANLRSSKQTKIETRKRKQEEKTSSSDLMADLHAKLALRRKGISGAKAEVSVGSAMERVSAMIPPPQLPEPDSFQENGEEGMDEDWD